MLDKPTRHQQPHGQQNRNNRQPILPCPPQRQQEAHAKHNTRDLASHDVESAERQQRPNQTRSKIPGRKRDELLAAAHVRHAAFVRVQTDGFHAAAGAAGCDCVAKLVEGDDQHLGMLVTCDWSGVERSGVESSRVESSSDQGRS